jgi:hypothetical protein
MTTIPIFQSVQIDVAANSAESEAPAPVRRAEPRAQSAEA